MKATPEQLTKFQKYYRSHREERLAFNKKYYSEHKEQYSIKRKKTYKESNGEELRKSKEYQKQNRERINKRSVELRRKKRIDLINLYGGKCIRCGFNDWRALQIDHINGGGKKEKATFKGYKDYYKMLKQERNSGKYQLLCANCNWIKKFENKEY